ncbi:hypothetical protein BJ878DRAFT_30916 [Calycina marina]|uniref:Uncharacterized protein n=1 Tax=Calycina marina TaxID=1763456 RepID=A0A9P8CFI9_9HELO|nr:hypothetical protein BJ878DRAFT_30916 [Calycina marina]
MSINWATIDPENRLYKGKSLYRWEVSPGLEHHCGTCATPLHNARAKTSCLGLHVEPCYRFHQQLHFLGKSHECFGCNKSDEMHHNRHKEILRIIRKFTELDSPENLHPTLNSSLLCGNRRRSDTQSSITDTSSETTLEDGSGKHMTRSQRKKEKKSKINDNKRRNMEVFPREDTDFVSEAIHLKIHESKGAWQGTYDYEKTAHILEKLVEEVKEAEDRTEDFDISTLSIKDAHEMTPRQRRNKTKLSTPAKHDTYGGGSRKYMYNRDTFFDVYDCVDPEIFVRLGVKIVSPAHNSSARKELVTKLVAAIKDDLQVIAQENKEAIVREEGFWRWAGKSAWHNIMEVRKTIDWATGQKIDPSIHRPHSDVSDMPVFDDAGVAPDITETGLRGLAVQPPSTEPLVLPEESDMSTEEVVSPTFKSMTKLKPVKEGKAPADDDGFEVVTKTKGKKTAAPAKVIRPTKNFSARKTLVKNERIAKAENHDADVSTVAMASKIAPKPGTADETDFTNTAYLGGKRRVFAARH